jgi:hypothetical protein
MPDKSTKFLIIGTGRSGTSLLAAILADSGANFGLPKQANWNSAHGGIYEHPKFLAAVRWRSRASKLAASIWPDALGRRFCERQMKQALRDLFSRADYTKMLPDMVGITRQFGYPISIIVSYRSFNDYAASRMLRLGWSYDKTEKVFIDTYRTTLMYLSILGGCVVSYEDIITPAQTDWAAALAQVTSLEARQMLAFREQRVDKRHKNRNWTPLHSPVIEPHVEAIYMILESLRGKVVTSQYF